MKRRNTWNRLVVLLCLAFTLTACSNRVTDESSQYESLPDNPLVSSSSVSTTASLSSSQSASVDKTESNRKPIASSAPNQNSSSASSSLPEVNSRSSSASKAKQDISITVKKKDLIEAKEKVINDEAQMKKILAFVDGMFKSDFTGPPPMGGEIMSVFITRNGNSEEYSILEDKVDGYCLAKNHQDPDVKNTWYFADAEAFSYLSKLFK